MLKNGLVSPTTHLGEPSKIPVTVPRVSPKVRARISWDLTLLVLAADRELVAPVVAAWIHALLVVEAGDAAGERAAAYMDDLPLPVETLKVDVVGFDIVAKDNDNKMVATEAVRCPTSNTAEPSLDE